jgi:hypothetical protein
MIGGFAAEVGTVTGFAEWAAAFGARLARAAGARGVSELAGLAARGRDVFFAV